MKKIGLFGGTFDPLHFGHLNLALEILEARNLDQVLFCPAYSSPFRKERPPVASPQQREVMTELAIEDIPMFQLCTLELERQGASYTIDTLRALKESYGSSAQLYLLCSSEVLSQFHLWKEAEAIIHYAQPLIGMRKGSSKAIPDSPVKEALLHGMTVTTQMEISSTQIRDRIKQRLYCSHLLPAKVLDYIQKHHLYS